MLRTFYAEINQRIDNDETLIDKTILKEGFFKIWSEDISLSFFCGIAYHQGQNIKCRYVGQKTQREQEKIEYNAKKVYFMIPPFQSSLETFQGKIFEIQ